MNSEIENEWMGIVCVRLGIKYALEGENSEFFSNIMSILSKRGKEPDPSMYERNSGGRRLYDFDCENWINKNKAIKKAILLFIEKVIFGKFDKKLIPFLMLQIKSITTFYDSEYFLEILNKALAISKALNNGRNT